MHTKRLWIQSVVWLKISVFIDVQGLPRDVLCYYSLGPLCVLPAVFSAPQSSISSSQSSSQQLFMSGKKFNVPLVVSLWVEEWWPRGKLTGCKTRGIFFIHIFLFLIFFFLYPRWLGVYLVFENWEAVCDNFQRMSGQEIWCKFHWKKNLLPKGSPLQVSSDMKIQLSPQYWKVYCKQRAVSTHLLLMGSPPWSKHRMWLPGGPVSSEAALRLNLARSLSGAV